MEQDSHLENYKMSIEHNFLSMTTKQRKHVKLKLIKLLPQTK